MKPKLLLALVILAVLFPLSLIAGKPPITKWTVKAPFEQKVFIENKGQYQLQNIPGSSNVLYGARQEGLQYYFTSNSIWIKRTVGIKRTPQEIKRLQAEEEKDGGEVEEDKELKLKMVDEFHQMQFIGTDPSTEITSENEVSWYYNFAINKNIPVQARAYKKLIYHNLYPGIDMEFYFPENKEGFEYSFIVHPGADVSQIKIQYPLNEGLQLNEDGNLEIKSSYGQFTDHSPVASQSGNAVKSLFLLNGATVQFKVGDYDKTQNLIIDPWTITPTFVGTNSAFDVDWDNAGNCYAYGGSPPWQLIKYNSSGTMLWSFTEDFNSQYPYYGDFAVDRYSQSAYLVEGFNFSNGAGVIKVNSSGTQIGFFDGNQEFREMWRIAFSKCTNRAVIAGGGTSSPSYQACYLDTNLANLSPVNVLNNTQECCHDLWGITLDNFGSCYVATCTAVSNPDSFVNRLLKLPLPSLAPTTWDVGDGYNIWEASSTQFATNGSFDGLTNAYNGITISNTDLYTYDSYTLKKWNGGTGAFVSSAVVNTPAVSDSILSWGGLTSDDCDNVFAASGANIDQFNGSLSLINTITTPDTVYALRLATNNILFVGGDGYISALQVTIPSCYVISVTNNITNATCTTKGAATVSPSGGTPPYSIVWNTTPVQTGVSATNLSAGTYVATVTDSSCVKQVTYDTVKVLKVGSFLVTVNSPSICSGDSVFLKASGSSGYTWYPSSGLSATSGDSVKAYPTSTTTYFVVGYEGTCPDTEKAVVTVFTNSSLIITPPTPSICSGQSVTLTASGLLSYQWAPATGLNTTTGSIVTANPTITTTYTINGLSQGGCKADTTVTVVINPSPNVSVTPNAPSMCLGKSITLDASGASTYQWSPSTGLNTSTGTSVNADPSNTTTYTIVGFNGGCSDSITDVVTIDPEPIITVEPSSSSVCAGKEVLLSASGGTSYQWSPSAGLVETTGDTVTATVSISSTYSIIGSSAFGCLDTTTATISIIAPPSLTVTPSLPSICLGQMVTIIASGYETYQWSPSSGLNTTNGSSVVASPSVTTTYSVTGDDAIGCTNNAVATVTVDAIPTASFDYKIPDICSAPQQLQFTNTSTNGTTYLWNFGDGTMDTVRNPLHQYDKGGIYSVKLVVVSGDGCSDSISINDTISISSEIFAMPNAFTPNGDGINDYIFPIMNCNELTQYIFRVYNRWGEMVYSTNTPNTGWDGKYNGKAQPVGTYVYYLQFNCGTCSVNKKGNIELLR